jgi:hypothetical protein
MSALAEPLTTDEALRDHAHALGRELDVALAPERPSVTAVGSETLVRTSARKRRVERRQRQFEELRDDVVQLAKSPQWRAHDLARELLLTLEDLRAAIEADPDALDPEWREREAMMRMRVVTQAMVRQLDHGAIDNPAVAAKLVAETLADVELGEVARLLGATTKSVDNWRRGRVEQIKRNPSRIALIGALVYELRASMTPRGILLWFDAPREQFGGRTPRELLDADVADAAGKLLPLARGGRGQLDV